MATLPGTGTRINTHVYDWSSVTISAEGLAFGGISEINYSDKVELGELRGSGSIRRGTSRGQYSADGSFTIAKEDWETFKGFLALLGLGGFMEARFLIVCAYRELGAIIPVADKLETCRITAVENSHNQGNDPLMVKCTLDIQRICHNGVYGIQDDFSPAATSGL